MLLLAMVLLMLLLLMRMPRALGGCSGGGR
jgi:hypothetical protein